ncbi:MAG: hypothetical protein CTY19_12925 [Methylomonas sp.]|nr:MAG: hypothetical protein CTY19_12925 [Methylomonas sp.]
MSDQGMFAAPPSGGCRKSPSPRGRGLGLGEYIMQTADLYALILTFSRREKELFRLLRQLPPGEVGGEGIKKPKFEMQ